MKVVAKVYKTRANAKKGYEALIKDLNELPDLVITTNDVCLNINVGNYFKYEFHNEEEHMKLRGCHFSTIIVNETLDGKFLHDDVYPSVLYKGGKVV